MAVAGQPHLAAAQTSQTASIAIDARKIENRINPLLYGQFLEFMYEGIKGGLRGLIRNRSFEEPANVIGLSHAIGSVIPTIETTITRSPFTGTISLLTRSRRKIKIDSDAKEHSLRVRAGDGVIPRHGIYQPRSHQGRC